MCSRATVEYIAKKVQLVDDKMLNNNRYGNDEIVGSARAEYGVDDSSYIFRLIFVVCPFVKQFFDYITKVSRKCFSYLRPCVFA